jgi:hypothetical protein
MRLGLDWLRTNKKETTDMPEWDNKDGAVKPEDVKATAAKEVDRKPAKADTRTAAVKQKQTLTSAYELLTGNQLDTQNNSNVFGQLDRAFRQSNDEVLKEKIAKDFGFDYTPRGGKVTR